MTFSSGWNFPEISGTATKGLHHDIKDRTKVGCMVGGPCPEYLKTKAEGVVVFLYLMPDTMLTDR